MTGALQRGAAIACALFGLATLGVFIAFQMLPEVNAAAACGRPTSLIEFQQARSMDDLIAVFSAPGGACRAPMIASMNAQNQLDLFVFIPVYALFLAAAVLMLARSPRAPIVWCGLAAIAVGVIGDVLETYTQLRITENVEAATPMLGPLAYGYWMKYAGLGAHAAIVALLALWRPQRLWIIVALGALAAILTLAAASGQGGPTALAFAPLWLGQLATAILFIVRPAQQQSSVHKPT